MISNLSYNKIDCLYLHINKGQCLKVIFFAITSSLCICMYVWISEDFLI